MVINYTRHDGTQASERIYVRGKTYPVALRMYADPKASEQFYLQYPDEDGEYFEMAYYQFFYDPEKVKC